MPISGVQPTCDHVHIYYYKQRLPILFPSIVSEEEPIKENFQCFDNVNVLSIIPDTCAIASGVKESIVLNLYFYVPRK